jgi:hypothetical protein
MSRIDVPKGVKRVVVYARGLSAGASRPRGLQISCGPNAIHFKSLSIPVEAFSRKRCNATFLDFH